MAKHTVNGDLGKGIAERRLCQARSQAELARFSGAPISTLRRVEAGESVHAATVARIAATLAGLDAVASRDHVNLDDRLATLELQLAKLDLNLARSRVMATSLIEVVLDSGLLNETD